MGFREVGVVEVREVLRGWLEGAGLRRVAERASHWIGGLVIDAEHQGKGLGRATVEAVLALWEDQEPSLSGTPYHQAALSVTRDNETALRLYRSLGFVETGERSDDEFVLRRSRAHGS